MNRRQLSEDLFKKKYVGCFVLWDTKSPIFPFEWTAHCSRTEFNTSKEAQKWLDEKQDLFKVQNDPKNRCVELHVIEKYWFTNHGRACQYKYLSDKLGVDNFDQTDIIDA